MTNYVAGFLFSPDLKRVALIRKNKPEWQKGKLNGIGGKVEIETPYDAMVREFQEETGAATCGWNSFASLERADFCVAFFHLTGDYELRTTTGEAVGWYPVAKLDKLAVIPNLRWLIPLALDCSTLTVTAEAA